MVTQRDLLQNLESDYTKFIERKLKHTKGIRNFLPERSRNINCMMWTNPHKESVTLKYNYRIKEK